MATPNRWDKQWSRDDTNRWKDEEITLGGLLMWKKINGYLYILCTKSDLNEIKGGWEVGHNGKGRGGVEKYNCQGMIQEFVQDSWMQI